jgi:hypothetical protein
MPLLEVGSVWIITPSLVAASSLGHGVMLDVVMYCVFGFAYPILLQVVKFFCLLFTTQQLSIIIDNSFLHVHRLLYDCLWLRSAVIFVVSVCVVCISVASVGS